MKTYRTFFLLTHLLHYTEREKNLKKILFPPPLFPPKFNKNESSSSNCDNCDICKIYLISDKKFKCKVSRRVQSVRGSWSRKSPNVYIISCKTCGDQYIDSSTDIITRIRIHKSDVKSKGDRCGTVSYFNNICCYSNNPHIFYQVKLIESVQSDVNLEATL